MNARFVCLITLSAIWCLSCSRQPETPPLTDEQVKAAKFLQEQFDPRFSVINERLGKISFDDEDKQMDWILTLTKLAEQFNIRKVESGHEAAIAWYDTESKKPAEGLIAQWGPKGDASAVIQIQKAKQEAALQRQRNDTLELMLQTVDRLRENATNETWDATTAFLKEWDKRSEADLPAAVEWANRTMKDATPDGFVRACAAEKWGHTTD